ncbi:MAG TPA: MBG domain-containing protein, partial [Candidatus Acidoferrum sp.]|nr:MBG domain-containing protein [Candidatus Acidoferrum sp.]
SWTSETTWSWFSQPLQTLNANATSGGVSPTWSLPVWQQGISTTTNKASTSFRNIPDVALLANDIFLYADNGTQEIAGGTSAAAPLWAGLTALINQQRVAEAQPAVGFLNPALYAIAKSTNYLTCFHDITVGNNTNLHSGTLYNSAPGYDLCTGLGSPIGPNLISNLCPEPLLVLPSAGFSVSGFAGGPFVPSSQTLLLTNIATVPFNWALGEAASWLSASISSGTLSNGLAATTVTISLNSTVNSLAVGVYTNTVCFTNLNDLVVQSRQYILTVTKTVPTVTWANPASITYGTSLGTAQLNATATVPGTFTYLPPGGSVLTVGTRPLDVIFNPNDAVDYGSVTTGVSLVVARAPLTVTAASAARPFGQANPVFSGSISGLQNGDNITVLYNCSAINGSMAGTYPIVPSLVDPADLETNYTVDLINGLFSVQPTTPTLNWINPASITYGTALGSAQLNATANIPGSYVYFPATGSVLFPGAQPLTVIFSPADAVDYTTATTGVSLVVSPAPLTLTATPVSLTYGDTIPPLSGTVTGFVGLDNQANATTGSLSFTTPATATSPVGNYAITGSGLTASNYIFVQAIGNTNALTINPATPLVTWTNPAAITYGTALSGAQLDATANVAGNFAYTPAAGTMPGVGLQVLSADFTPVDTTNYNSVNGTTVSLLVNPASPPVATNIAIIN